MKSKAGLHKKISSIFDGVPIPGSTPGNPSVSSDTAGLAGPGGGKPTESVASGEGTGSSLSVMMDTASASGPISAGLAHGTGNGRKSWFRSLGERTMSGKRPSGKAALVTALVVVFGLVLVMVFKSPATGKAGQAAAKSDKESTDAKKTAALPVWTIPEPFPAGLRDPMVPVEPVKPVEVTTPEVIKPTLFVIKGVVLGAGGNSAIVGSEIVSVNDMVQGAKVVRIDRGEVEFEKDGQRWVQTVEP